MYRELINREPYASWVARHHDDYDFCELVETRRPKYIYTYENPEVENLVYCRIDVIERYEQGPWEGLYQIKENKRFRRSECSHPSGGDDGETMRSTVLALLLVLAGSGTASAAEWRFEVGLGAASSFDSTLTLEQDGLPPLEIDARWENHPEEAC